MFLNRRQRAALFLDDDQQVAMQDADLLANCPADNEQRLEQYGQIGKFRDNSLIRASNLTLPIMPTFRPKLRRVARRSFSIAMAFD
jgi:hypothetical protein